MKRRTEDQWRTLFTEQASSGLTVEAFCKERELNPSYFSFRRKQLSDQHENGAAPSFVPVTVTGQGNTMMIELHLSKVLQLRVPTTVSPHWLAELVQQLRA